MKLAHRFGLMIFRATFCLLLLAILHLALRASPAIQSVPGFPRPFAVWFDQHDALKNFFGFFALAATGFLAFPQIPTGGSNSGNWPRRLRGQERLLAAFALLIVALELIQLALPRRSCDWKDVLTGWAGALTAWLMVRLLSPIPRPDSRGGNDD